MPIYVDVSAAVHRRAGLGRYAESLVKALAPKIDIALFYNREHGIEPLEGLGHLPSHSIAMEYKPWRMLVALGHLLRIPANRLTPDAGLFHATEHLLLPLRHIPTVMTVHDLIFRQLPEHHKPLNRWYLNLTMPLYCRRADHIIAVSQATRRDLIQAYHLPPEKITVIYEAADPRFQLQSPERIAEVRAQYSLPDDYILYVGTIEPRKNLTRLLRVWQRLYAAGACPPLVLVGKRGWLTSDFFATLEACPVRDAVVLPGYIKDSDLPAVYSGARVFVMPSLYEGFGLPPLEAMACGAPVLSSAQSSLPEVVGDAARLFDPTDEAALEQSLVCILKDRAQQEELRARGLARAAQFSWERAADETIAVYQRTMSGYHR